MSQIVIVGGGIIGTGLAYYLREADADVTLVEKNQIGSGTSQYGTAMFSWFFPHPADYLFRRRSWEGWRHVIEAADIEHNTVGNVTVAQSEEALAGLREIVAVQQAYGVESEIIGPDEAAEYGFDPDAVVGAMHSPHEGFVNQQEFMEFYVRQAEANGVDIRTGVEVQDVTLDDGRVSGVETSEGFIEADTVVNAAGPWAPRLNDMVGVSLPLRHGRAKICVLQFDEPHGLPYLGVEDDHYFRPEGASKMLAGRHVGLAGKYHELGEHDPDHSHTVDEEFRLAVVETVDEVVPGLKQAEIVNDWVGVVCVSPDGRPMVGPTTVDGFLTATGMSGAGISQHAAVAMTLSDYLRTGEPSDTLQYLSPMRYMDATTPDLFGSL
ncbi:NAD(P)/FAD-dependent oxidoreductase [Haloglomus litoreum]|uniref:NAD(P)/FAD-dependent oxidoreductase n=1 Tax=Haloglomus litoreum TaxID=3034026 RepID=UPI0023E7B5F9|nr:FAD-dependent oxidoreductase [Haloglomus sp. DT116]